MIKPSDAALLAYTKLRTRKVRLTITVVISALLFSGLVGASLVTRGVFGSLASFNKEGLGDRYIVSANGQTFVDIFNDATVSDRAIAIHKDIVARKKVEAKKLGIEYDAATDPPPVTEYDGPAGKLKSLNPDHPASEQAIKEYIAQHPAPSLADFEKLAKPYGLQGLYQQRSVTGYGSSGVSLQVLKEGKEKFDSLQSQFAPTGPPNGTDSFLSGWNLMSEELLRPFLLPDADMKVGADGVIPVVAPYTATEQLLGLTSLTASATPEDRLARLKEVRERAQEVTFSVCYRNKTSSQLVSEAISVREEIERNKNNKEYQKPSLIYSLPEKACGPVAVGTDKRTTPEKQAAAKQETFRQMFGEPPARQEIVTFRIVGVVPDLPTGNASVVTELVSGLVMSSLGMGWFTPLSAEQLPVVKEIEQAKPALVNITGAQTFFGELATANQARKLMEEKNCESEGFVQSAVGAPSAPIANCAQQGKPFALSPFGSSSLALDGVKKGFGRGFSIAAMVVAGVASLILMGIVGRTIADSRRETAVFRAIGAKRMDIVQIYITYAIFLGLLVGVVALVGGFVLATVAHQRWSADLTVSALVAYNARDLTKSFSLYGFYARDLLYIFGLLLAAGLVSTIFPLVRNVRRNPIRDMRDEN